MWWSWFEASTDDPKTERREGTPVVDCGRKCKIPWADRVGGAVGGRGDENGRRVRPVSVI